MIEQVIVAEESKTRRPLRALLLAATLLGTLLPLSAVESRADNGTVTIVSWGGRTQEGQRKAVWEPVAKELGITIKEDTLSSNGDIRARVQAGNHTWDIVDIGSSGCVQLAKEGLLEPLDYSVIDTKGLDPRLVNEYWVGWYLFSTLLAWNKSAFPADAQPTGWKDFWDVERFPGPRALRNDTAANLEYALIADGVPIDQLYPLDVDRAFRKLEEIKPHISVWWQSGAQSVQLLQNGEVDLTSLWNGRADEAEKLGVDIGYTYAGATLDFECLLIPKGAPNKELAQKVIARIIDPAYEAAYALLIPYGPANPAAYETGIIPPDLAAKLPSSPENVKVQALVDPAWWLENGPAVTERFQAFIQQ